MILGLFLSVTLVGMRRKELSEPEVKLKPPDNNKTVPGTPSKMKYIRKQIASWMCLPNRSSHTYLKQSKEEV